MSEVVCARNFLPRRATLNGPRMFVGYKKEKKKKIVMHVLSNIQNPGAGNDLISLQKLLLGFVLIAHKFSHYGTCYCMYKWLEESSHIIMIRSSLHRRRVPNSESRSGKDYLPRLINVSHPHIHYFPFNVVRFSFLGKSHVI